MSLLLQNREIDNIFVSVQACSRNDICYRNYSETPVRVTVSRGIPQF